MPRRLYRGDGPFRFDSGSHHRDRAHCPENDHGRAILKWRLRKELLPIYELKGSVSFFMTFALHEITSVKRKLNYHNNLGLR